MSVNLWAEWRALESIAIATEAPFDMFDGLVHNNSTQMSFASYQKRSQRLSLLRIVALLHVFSSHVKD